MLHVRQHSMLSSHWLNCITYHLINGSSFLGFLYRKWSVFYGLLQAWWWKPWSYNEYRMRKLTTYYIKVIAFCCHDDNNTCWAPSHRLTKMIIILPRTFHSARRQWLNGTTLTKNPIYHRSLVKWFTWPESRHFILMLGSSVCPLTEILISHSTFEGLYWALYYYRLAFDLSSNGLNDQEEEFKWLDWLVHLRSRGHCNTETLNRVWAWFWVSHSVITLKDYWLVYIDLTTGQGHILTSA